MATTSDSTKKIQEALALLNEAAAAKKDELGSLMSGKYDQLKGVVMDAEGAAEEKARQGLHRAREMGHESAEALKSTANRVDQKVHDDPWKSMGWAVAGAFAVGFLLGRKD